MSWYDVLVYYQGEPFPSVISVQGDSVVQAEGTARSYHREPEKILDAIAFHNPNGEPVGMIY